MQFERRSCIGYCLGSESLKITLAKANRKGRDVSATGGLSRGHDNVGFISRRL